MKLDKEFPNITKDDGTAYTQPLIFGSPMLLLRQENGTTTTPTFGHVSRYLLGMTQMRKLETITITLHDDNNDSNIPARYEVASTATPATVRVIDVPLPTLEISTSCKYT